MICVDVNISIKLERMKACFGFGTSGDMGWGGWSKGFGEIGIGGAAVTVVTIAALVAAMVAPAVGTMCRKGATTKVRI